MQVKYAGIFFEEKYPGKTNNMFLGTIVLILLCITAKGQYVFPLKNSSNNRYLVDQTNKPFPILGRTAWFIISQTEEGYKKFIENTIEHGYNSIEMHVLNHDPRGNHPPFNGNGDAPFLKCLNSSSWNGNLFYTNANAEAPDFVFPNEKYWQFVDEFLSYCEAKGILVFMFPAYVGYNGAEQGWMREMVANGPAKVEAYGSWIANRYKNRKNIVWMLLGDMGTFNNEQKKAEAALIKGLKSVQGQQSIYYSAEASGGQNSTDQIDFGNEITLNGTYTWGTISVPALGRKAYSHDPVMPAYLLEEPYDEEGPDGNKVNPHAIQPVRRFQWWGWLSTIGGYISGNGYVWPFNDPAWKQHLNTQGALDMQRLNSFIKSIEWWKLVPSGLNGMKTLIVDENNADNSEKYIAAAAAGDGSLLIAYMPPAYNGNVTVDMSVLKGKVYSYWFDPTSGKYISITNSPLKNKGTYSFKPARKNSAGEWDWVLVFTTKKI